MRHCIDAVLHGGSWPTWRPIGEQCWYADAIILLPDYLACRSHPDARLRKLALWDAARYGPVVAPLLALEALEGAPVPAMWVSLLAHLDGGMKYHERFKYVATN